MISFGPDICSNLEGARSREWLETNGIGGFASSTIAGLHSRRYHGLLIASLKPPAERYLLLSKFEETLHANGKKWELSANQYPGVIHPQGYQYLREFRLDPFPTFLFELDGIRIEKSIFMVQGENTTVVQYLLQSSAECELELRSLIAFRDYHSTTHENTGINRGVQSDAGTVLIHPYNSLPALHFGHNADETQETGDWYRNLEYEIENQRGLDWKEDLFNPFSLKFCLKSGSSASIIISTEEQKVESIPELRRQEIERRGSLLKGNPAEDELAECLVSAADQFIVNRGNRKSIIAGYHWFSDWGRDTMIALPGLAMTTGRYEIAKDILLQFAQHVDQGMLPNRFPDAGEKPEYNTVDATLWFFEAARELVQSSGDFDFVRSNLYAVLSDILEWHIRGTRYNIHADEDGLLFSGEAGVQLTWMDAKIGGWVVTPRYGKPVEIQALWYSALRTMADFSQRLDDRSAAKKYQSLAAKAKTSFNALFWNESAGCLYDVVNVNDRDDSIRPNQVLAASLEHTMLSKQKAASILDVVERELLTPYGLRTLAPGDPQYRGRYEGGPQQRDSAYHQGTVWPWLLGPWIAACLKVRPRTQKNLVRAAERLQPLKQHLTDAGLGQISEIFDGDPPHEPKGCIAQAWSVSEILRALVAIGKATQTQKKADKADQVRSLTRQIANQQASSDRRRQ
jgi:predicted glycogen debranching enzyme